MSEQLTLSAETRDRVGKGASRALRREGRVPAVIYGNKQAPASITVSERELVKALGTGHFMNSVVMVAAGGRPVRTLPKDVHFDPVTDRPLHVDFLRISEHATVTVAVPIAFVDEEDAPGIKRGGVLNIVRHELDLVCDAADIPAEITVSLKGLEVGDTIHLSNITLPKGTESSFDDDRDPTIATVIAPSAMKADVQESLAEADALAAEAAAEQQAEEAEAAADDAEGEATDGETPEGGDAGGEAKGE